MKTAIVNERQEAEINEIIAFAEKTVYLRTGVNLKIFTNVKNGIADELTHPPAAMLQKIATTLGCNLEELQAKSRKPQLVEIRQLCALLLRRYYKKLTLKQIGLFWGWMDHTSVSHSIDKANQLLENKNQHFTAMYIKAIAGVEKWLGSK